MYTFLISFIIPLIIFKVIYKSTFSSCLSKIIAYSLLICFVSTVLVNTIIVACLPTKTNTEVYKYAIIVDTVYTKRDTAINKVKATVLDTTLYKYEYKDKGNGKFIFNIKYKNKCALEEFNNVKFIKTKELRTLIRYTTVKFISEKSAIRHFIFNKLPVYKEVVIVFS